MSHYLIGLDVGTTNIKAVAFDLCGNEAAQASLPTPVIPLGSGRAVYDPDTIWESFVHLLRQVMEQLPPQATIEGLAITGMGESGLLMNNRGESLSPIIAWYDNRMTTASDWWKETFDQQRMIQIAGQRTQYIFAANKLLWLRQQQPQVFAQAWKWLCIEGFLAYRLTGQAAMEYSIACRTMLLDIGTRSWSRELLDHGGIPLDLLPRLVAAGEQIGMITPEAAAATTLPAGTPIFAGGHDHVCGALAAGVVRPGDVLDSSGTAELIFTPTVDLEQLRRQGGVGFNAGIHVAKGLFYLSGGITSSGVTTDWFQTASGVTRTGHAQKVPGANGLLFLPHLRGSSSPLRDPRSLGSFVGISEKHTLYDFSQAVCEGLCFEYRLVQEQLLQGVPPRKIVAIGGGSRNLHWMQTKANILGQAIQLSQVGEATALGAALLAGIGAGIYRDEADALAKAARSTHPIEPDLSLKPLYDHKFSLYRQLNEALLPIHSSLSQDPG